MKGQYFEIKDHIHRKQSICDMVLRPMTCDVIISPFQWFTGLLGL